MTGPPSLWIRGEDRASERRAPVVPADAGRLVEAGYQVTVEDSAQRCFPIEAYAAAGCLIVAAGSWPAAPTEAFVIGLKELPDLPWSLEHRHIYFGHAYKAQSGSDRLLQRFVEGGGSLLDLEYLVDDDGRRLAAFGYWAGYLGAALAVLQYRGALTGPLAVLERSVLDAQLRQGAGGAAPSVLVVGALGRSGHGARDALAMAGIAATGWDVAETSNLDRGAVIKHDLLINAVLVDHQIPPFLTAAEVADAGRLLSVICDISCDVRSPFNVLPIYQQLTCWQRPVTRLCAMPPLDLIAIDNLPALLPVAASTAFSADLTPQLVGLAAEQGGWRNCARAFERATQSLASQSLATQTLGTDGEVSDD